MVGWTVRPHWMGSGWWLKVWEGQIERSCRGGGFTPKSQISSHMGSILMGVGMGSRVGENTQLDEGYVVVDGVGGVNCKITQARGCP